MYQALEVASSEAAAPAAASALYIYYDVIGGCFAPSYKYMVKYTKQKQQQQQEQQLQSLLPPELDTLTLHEGGCCENERRKRRNTSPLHLLPPLYAEVRPCILIKSQRSAIANSFRPLFVSRLTCIVKPGQYSKGLNKGSPPLMFSSPPSWSVNVSSSGGSKL